MLADLIGRLAVQLIGGKLDKQIHQGGEGGKGRGRLGLGLGREPENGHDLGLRDHLAIGGDQRLQAGQDVFERQIAGGGLGGDVGKPRASAKRLDAS